MPTKPEADTNVIWKNPPPKRTGQTAHRRGRMIAFVEVLKTRPNEWAIYDKKHKNAVVVSIAKKKFPKTEWTSRTNPDGKTYTIYGRYIGK